MKTNHLGAGVFAIEDFLSPQECVQYIAQSEALGYTEAAIRTDAGESVYGDARNNDRIIVDDETLALRLYRRASPLLPAESDGWQLHGFNARLRYYRYDQQQQFVWHQDGTVRLSETLESVLTFMVYLNDNFEGGSTDCGWESVKPVQGMALVFPHRLRHRGAVVTSGVKYVLRTDVMYQRGPIASSSIS